MRFNRTMFSTALAACLLFSLSAVNAQTVQTGQHFYLIKDDVTGQIVRRGEAGSNGIAFDNLILAPETPYTAWILQAETLYTGSVSFFTPLAGRVFNVPDIFIGPSYAPDTDGDGLTDDGEMIMGTFIAEADSDGDGIGDGAEIQQGTDPLEGKAVRTGIIGAVDTPGDATGICALDDIVAIADGGAGVSVFNVFNGMQPVLIAQVDTPGSATAVACAGSLIAVADGSDGLAVIDIGDPPASAILHQIPLNGSVHAVTVVANIAYVGMTTGELAKVDIITGNVLEQIDTGNDLQDVAVAGDVLYALSKNNVFVLPLTNTTLQITGSVPMSGTFGVGQRRFRLFIGGGVLYAIHNQGYNTYDLTDPLLPALIATSSDSVVGWKNIVLNGAGLGVGAVGTASNDTGQHDITIYDVSDPATTLVLLTQYPTPGITRDVAIYNGIAYAADGDQGLQVINYLAYDALGVPPTVLLASNAINDEIVAGQRYRLTAEVGDDVQVRNVEFYVDGAKVATDGNYPFEVNLIAPPLSSVNIAVSARASDTGGNATWTDEITLTIVPDNTPPEILSTVPVDGKVLAAVTAITAFASEPVDPASITPATIELTEAGVDGLLGTDDDQPVPGGIVSVRNDVAAINLDFETPLAAGHYQATVATSLTDFSNNPLQADVSWTFTIFSVDDDRDGDGVPDALESALGLDPDNPDSDDNGITDGNEDFDGDGSGNALEVVMNTDATLADSDGDGILDGDEDTDRDGITDVDEFTLTHSDRFDPDTDDDGINDGIENLFGSDLLDPGSMPMAVATARDSVASAGRVMYDITVSNLGDQAIDNVVISYLVPAEQAFHESADVSPDADTVSCGGTATSLVNCVEGHEAFWTLGTLGAGESRTIQVNALLLDGLADGTLVTALINLTGADLGDTVDVEKTIVVRNALDVDLALTRVSNPVAPGQTYRLAADLGYIGSETLSDGELRLQLPVGVTLARISDDGTQDAASGEVIWPLTSVAAGSALHRQVDLVVDADAVAGQILQSRIELRPDGESAVTAAAETIVTVDTDTGLQAVLALSPNPVAPGGPLDYEIAVSNLSTEALDNVVVFHRVPEGIGFNENSDLEPDADSISCGGSATSLVNCIAGHEAFWTLGTLAVGESRTLRVSGTVDTDRVNGGLITVPLVVGANGSHDVSLEKTVAVQNIPAIELALTSVSDPVVPGQSYRLAVDMGYTGSEALGGSELRLQPPIGVTLSQISDDGAEDTTTGDIVWPLPSLASGSAVHRQVDLIVDADVVAGQILQSRIALYRDGSMAVEASDETNVTVDADTGLQAVLALSPNPVAPGSPLDYEITVSNLSVQALDNVVVFHRVPEGIGFNENSDVEPDADSISCGGSATSLVNCIAGHEVYWTLGTLAVGESRTLRVSSTVDTDRVNGGLITVPLVVSANGSHDVSLEKTVAVQNIPDIELALTSVSDPVAPGETYRLAVDLGYTGSEALGGSELRLQSPVGVTLSQISDDGVEDTTTGDIIWPLASLAPGSIIHRQVDLIVDADAVAGQVLQSRIELYRDGVMAVEASAEANVTVDTDTGLRAVLALSPNPVAPGGPLDYEIAVSNLSTEVLDDVVVFHRVPEGIGFNENSDAEPDADSISCGGSATSLVNCVAGHEVYWTLGTLSPGESRTVQITSDVDTGLVDGGLITVPLVVSAGGSGAVSLEKSVAVQTFPDIELALTSVSDPVAPGQTYRLSVDLGYTGSEALASSELRLRLPAGVTLSQISDDGMQDAASGDIVWMLTSVAPGSAAHRQVDLTVDTDVAIGEILQSRIELRRDGEPAVTAATEAIVTVAADSGLHAALALSPNPVTPGGALDYEITVSNLSAEAVDNVVVFHRVPEGIGFNENSDVEPDADSISCGGSATSLVNCVAGHEVYWTLGTLSPGESRTVQITSDVDTGLVDGGLITVPLVVSAGGSGAVSLEKSVAVQTFPDIELALTSVSDPVAPGQTYRLSVDLGYTGSEVLASSELRLRLPAGVTLSQVSDDGTEEVVTGDVLWPLANLAPGTAVHRQVDLVVDVGAVAGQILNARIEWLRDGSVAVDASAEVIVTVAVDAPMQATLLLNPNPVIAGSQLDFEITVSNLSTEALDNVVAFHRVPDGIGFNENTDVEPDADSISCGGSATSLVNCIGGHEVIWTLGTLAAGESRTIQVSSTVDVGVMGGELITVPWVINATGSGAVYLEKSAAVTQAQ